jgi:hypothetical protein
MVSLRGQQRLHDFKRILELNLDSRVPFQPHDRDPTIFRIGNPSHSILYPQNPWAEHTFMAAMAMVWELLTQFEISLKNKNFEPFFKRLLLRQKS